jgi:hypothetical protein
MVMEWFDGQLPRNRFSQEANGFNSRTLRQRKVLLNGRQLVLKTRAS